MHGVTLRVRELREAAVRVHLVVDCDLDLVRTQLRDDRVEVGDAKIDPHPDGPSGAPSTLSGNGANTVAPASCVQTVPS